MIYIYLKILHIISAACVLTSMAYSFHLWRSAYAHYPARTADRIQKQTALVIIPCSLLQLASGFTMISLQRYDWSAFWISGSVISFIIAILSWFGFIYFLLLSQQLTTSIQNHSKLQHYRRYQAFMLLCCVLGLLSMIFFMANKSG